MEAWAVLLPHTNTSVVFQVPVRAQFARAVDVVRFRDGEDTVTGVEVVACVLAYVPAASSAHCCGWRVSRCGAWAVFDIFLGAAAVTHTACRLASPISRGH